MTIGNHDDTTATKGIVVFPPSREALRRGLAGALAAAGGVTGVVAALTVLALVLGVSAWSLSAQQGPAPPQGYITGVVQSDNGAEAGVWVIAETRDLPTPFIKIVVTDDRGRFMLPELPAATYGVWVRGYGLLDSSPTRMTPGATPVTLRAAIARTPQEAARVYPGDSWLSLLEPPAKTRIPRHRPRRQRPRRRDAEQNHWINSLKSDCNFCHQLGNRLTRSVDHILKAKPELKTHAEAWEWRLGTGVRGNAMYAVLQNQGKNRPLRAFAGWTERIAKGEVPPAPPRPAGVGAQPRPHAVGLGHGPLVHARRGGDRQAASDVNAGGPIYAVSAGPWHARDARPGDEPRRTRSRFRRARRGRRCRRDSRSRIVRRSGGVSSICGAIRRTTPPIRTTR